MFRGSADLRPGLGPWPRNRALNEIPGSPLHRRLEDSATTDHAVAHQLGLQVNFTSLMSMLIINISEMG